MNITIDERDEEGIRWNGLEIFAEKSQFVSLNIMRNSEKNTITKPGIIWCPKPHPYRKSTCQMNVLSNPKNIHTSLPSGKKDNNSPMRHSRQLLSLSPTPAPSVTWSISPINCAYDDIMYLIDSDYPFFGARPTEFDMQQNFLANLVSSTFPQEKDLGYIRFDSSYALVIPLDSTHSKQSMVLTIRNTMHLFDPQGVPIDVDNALSKAFVQFDQLSPSNCSQILF